MTWNGLCPYRNDPLPGAVAHEGRDFHLTVNSRGAVHINCAEQTCNAFIGTLEPRDIHAIPQTEPH